MGGKSSTTTQQVQIPPEVLARYNAVNARAEQAASTPFQPYSYNPADFVAQLSPTQLAGIQNINYAAGQAQPYYDEATGQLMGAQQAATPYYGAAADIYGQAYGQAQPMQDYAWNQLSQAGNIGQTLAQRGLSSIDYGQYAAAPLQDMAGQAYMAAYQNAQPINQYSLDTLARAGQIGEQLGTQSLGTIGQARQIGEQLAGRSLGTLDYANYAASPLQQQAAEMYGGAYGQAQPLNQLALQQYYGGLGAAQPLSEQALANLAYGQQQGQQLTGGALSGLGAAQAAAYPYQQMATQYAATGAAPVSPGYLNTAAYMSPYMQGVVAPTAALLNQQNQQAMAGQTANAIRSGAFGGDRAAIAAANLAQQQQLATGKVLGELMQTGYGQALSTAQQQQQLALQAEQANRAAQAAAGQQMLGIGQQGFGQALSAAQQQQAAAQQLFGLGATTAQQQAALAQQLYGQQFGVGQGVQNIAQQLYQQGLGTGQAQQSLAQQLFGQGATTAQQQAAIAQQLFGQGATEAQQQAAMSQQLFGQGATSAQQQAAMAQQMYQQAMGLGQAQQGLGQQLFQQGLAAGQAQSGIGQQLFGQGAQQSQQQAALAQQRYQQGMGLGQAQQGIGKELYGMGAATAQQLAALGQGAQGAALQGAQAQLAAGQAQQQTAQAGLQALYNQYLQQQGYPFQVAQFLANVAMGTGALSGSTTTTNQPGGLFSDERVKENIRRIGKTEDGQPIYAYNYKGDPKEHTQIGLIAQEVEKKHPDAVGLAGGIKTVNYDKATRKAAGLARHDDVVDAEYTTKEGGHVHPDHTGLGFADGGMPYSMPGADGLNIPTQMDGPKKLQTPGSPGAGKSVIGDIKDLADTAKAGKDLYDTGSKLASFMGFADGGMPYGDPNPTKLDIPDDKPEVNKLELPGPAPKGRTVGEDVMDIAKIAAMFLSQGGRAGYADGGSPGLVSPSDMAALLQAQAQMFGPYSQFNRPMGGAPGGAGVVPQGSLPVAGLAVAKGDLPRQKSGMEQIQSAVSSGESLAKAYEQGSKIYDWAKDKLGSNDVKIPGATGDDLFKTSSAGGFRSNYASGGLAGRRGYDDGGGTPFDDFAKFVISQEGSGINPNEPGGGRSKLGITERWNPGVDINTLTPEKATDIYREKYWTPIGGDKLDPKIAPYAFDTSVLMGPGVANRFLRESGGDPDQFMQMRRGYLDRLVEQNPEKYGKWKTGWDKRNQALTEFASNRTPAAAPATGAPTGLAATTPPVAAPAPADVQPQGGVAAAGPTAPAPVETAATPATGLAAAEPKKQTEKPLASFRDWISKKENYIPLLSAISAVGAAPTRNLGVALTQGAGAYGAAAQRQREFELQQKQLEQSQFGRETERMQAQSNIIRNSMSIVGTRFRPIGNGMYFDSYDPTGKPISSDEYIRRISQLPGMRDYVRMPGAIEKLTSSGAAPSPAASGSPAGPQPSATPSATETSAAPAATPPVPVGKDSVPAVTAVPPGPLQQGLPTTSDQVFATVDARPEVKSLRDQIQKQIDVATEYEQKAQDYTLTPEVAQRYRADAATARTTAAQLQQNWVMLREQLSKPDLDNLERLRASRTDLDTKDLGAMRNQADAAYQQRRQLAEMRVKLENLKPGDLGPLTGEAVNIAKLVNQSTQALGGKPIFDTARVADLEMLMKDSTRLGFELSKSLGREPGFIVNQAITANPGISNSIVGARRLMSSLEEAAQERLDRNEFYEKWMYQRGNLVGAREAFMKEHPPQEYVNRAIVSSVDNEDRQALIDSQKNPAQFERYKSRIDQIYGKGTANLILGGK